MGKAFVGSGLGVTDTIGLENCYTCPTVQAGKNFVVASQVDFFESAGLD